MHKDSLKQKERSSQVARQRLIGIRFVILRNEELHTELDKDWRFCFTQILQILQIFFLFTVSLNHNLVILRNEESYSKLDKDWQLLFHADFIDFADFSSLNRVTFLHKKTEANPASVFSFINKFLFQQFFQKNHFLPFRFN